MPDTTQDEQPLIDPAALAEQERRKALEALPPPYGLLPGEHVLGGPPSIEDIAAMQRFFLEQRDDLIRRANQIEEMLGFVVTSGDLATRLAKIELFLGVKA